MTDTIWSKAKNLIELNGWAQGTAMSGDGCLCAGGAIAMALGFQPEEMWDSRKVPEIKQAFERFGDHVQSHHSYDSATRVYDFNDAQYRTEEDVLEALQELHDIEVAFTT